MNLALDFIALIISKGINALLLLLEAALLGRILGPEGFGQWSLLIAAATLLHSVFFNWTHVITVRFGSKEWRQCGSVRQTLNSRLPLLIAGLLLSILLIQVQPLNWLVKIYSIDNNSRWPVLLGLLSIWLMLETQSNMQAIGLLSRRAIIAPLATCMSVVFLVFILIGIHKDCFLLVAIGVPLLKALFWGINWFSSLKRTHYSLKLPEYYHVKEAIAFGWPAAPSLALGYVSSWGGHILLSIFCTTKEIGLWGASYQMMLGIISLNSILVTILLPWLLSRNQSIIEAGRFYLTDVIPTIFSLWLLIVVVIITFFPAAFFLCMGQQFNQTHNVLLILSFSIFTNIFSNLYGILFNLEQRLIYSLLYNFIVVVINCIVSMILIPRIGIDGAAIGVAVSYLVGHLIYIVDQHYFLDVPIYKTNTLFVMSLFICILQYFSGVTLWSRMIWCIISLLLLLFTFRKIDSIHPKFIIKYFTGLLQPLGFFIQKILIKSHAHEYH